MSGNRLKDEISDEEEEKDLGYRDSSIDDEPIDEDNAWDQILKQSPSS